VICDRIVYFQFSNIAKLRCSLYCRKLMSETERAKAVNLHIKATVFQPRDHGSKFLNAYYRKRVKLQKDELFSKETPGRWRCWLDCNDVATLHDNGKHIGARRHGQEGHLLPPLSGNVVKCLCALVVTAKRPADELTNYLCIIFTTCRRLLGLGPHTLTEDPSPDPAGVLASRYP